mmetsp:Transcript_92513/g.160727  ORF Transcript_92513/g.160727 Transcript_92513/m.160727 type:complete len:557 (+) Transcript_92513:79-1749(+)
MGNNGGKGDVVGGLPLTPETPLAQKVDGSEAESVPGFPPADDSTTSSLPAATQVPAEASLGADAGELSLSSPAPVTEFPPAEPELAAEVTVAGDTAAEAAAEAATTAAEVAESVLALAEEAADEHLGDEHAAEPSVAATSPFTPLVLTNPPVTSLSQEVVGQEDSTWTTVWSVSNEAAEPEPIVPQVSVKAAREKERRTLEQMMSLKPNDDERTAISKKISWILRHGAKKVGAEIDEEGWVRVKDMLALDIFEGIMEERLLSVVHESNAQKVRYELKHAEDGPAIKALSKELRNEKMKQAREAREARESYRERQDWQERKDDIHASAGHGGNHGHQREERSNLLPRRLERENRFTKRADMEGGEKVRRSNGLTFEQQLDQGYRPVYQGGAVVAMSRDTETIKPGSRDGKGKGTDEKGKGKGKRKGKQSIEKEFQPEEDEDEGKWRSKLLRWRVSPGLPVIVREGLSVQSDMVATLLPGTLVAQVSEDKVLEKGIIRMKIEALEEEGIEGWVTRTAQAAGGPCYFMPERGQRMPAKGRGKGYGAEKGGYAWQGGQRR